VKSAIRLLTAAVVAGVASSALIDHAPSLDHARLHAAELLRIRAAELISGWQTR